jgi:cytoskeletal protein RodZ
VESLGEKLRTARGSKGLSLSEVSRETNISVRFLEALEIEDFSSFPGETYITGFIRSYGSFLKLNPQELLSLYRIIKIQEQPVPVEKLIKAPSRAPAIIGALALVLVILALIGGGVYYLLFLRPKKPVIVSAPEVRVPAEYVMETDSLERRLYRYDSILIPVDASMYKLELANLGDAVTILTPGGSIILDLSQEVSVDLTNNGMPDLRIMVADFVKNNADMGALIHFYLVKTAVKPEDADAAQEPVRIASVAGASNTAIIPSTPNPYPFTLQLNFQGYCMFRWEILNERDRRDRIERYFQRSDELSVQAQNGIRVWTSNAQAARFQVIGGGRTFPMELGVAGEVVVAELRWVRDDDGRYRLLLIRLESGG